MHQTKQPKNFPPRQFPKQQYQKFNHHLWALIIGIIVIAILIGGAFIMSRRPTHHETRRHSMVTRTVRKPRVKPAHHQQVAVKATPKRGERLLGHWLIKLNYPAAKTQSILNNYQKSNRVKEKELAQKLNRDRQPDQVKKLINRDLTK